MKKNILITGGAGFVGSQLGFYLTEKGHDVTLVDNLSFGYLDNLAYKGKYFPKFALLDIREPAIDKYMKNIDIIYHFAGISSLPECSFNAGEAISVNVAGTANVLEIARRNEVPKIIFASTSAIYENENIFPTRENFTTNPTLIYSLSKKLAEELCESFRLLYSMNITILRFYNVYGPHMDYKRPNPPLVSYIIKCFLNGTVPILHSNGNQARDMIYVSDLLRLCEIVMIDNRSDNEIFNVGSGITVSVKEIYEIIANQFNSKSSPIYRNSKHIWEKYPDLFKGKYPLNQYYLEKEVNKFTQADITKTREKLDWSANISIIDGLRETVNFAKKNIHL